MNLKKKFIIVSLIAFIVGMISGYFISYYKGRSHIAKDTAFAIDLAISTRIMSQIDRATAAYNNEPSNVGIWALEGLIEEYLQILSNSTADNSMTFQSSYFESGSSKKIKVERVV